MSEVSWIASGESRLDQDMSGQAEHASRFRAEFRDRERHFLKRQARRNAIIARLPRWLHWLLPPVTRSRSW